uniref:Large ribosomal subunit protein uL4 n=1 Tax=Candidatus Kentrum sp. MB TaxID=2138164 RepID=A0A450XSL9_9GAMM|nr:MAG: LSU ribosomal protein L4P [Candidatus Kentron sp. MB]VFK32262.1 MAG: LSU ribosomal protein L4P [Candidatus Kentron sp. MB]VFK75778.1 MAG: LSU ribosomal protein L4P [Candidatus Kentron sp. MB]
MDIPILSEGLFGIASELENSDSEKIVVSDDVFGESFNGALIHQAVTTYLVNGWTRTRKQKNRSEVRGGGSKPYRQKGSGRARVGSIRNPLWRGGGVAFAARVGGRVRKLNKKMYQGALRSIVSQLIREERLLVVREFSVDRPKTRDVVERLRKIGSLNVLIVTEYVQNNVKLAVRNLVGTDVIVPEEVNPVSLIAYEKILITVSGLRKLEERLR